MKKKNINFPIKDDINVDVLLELNNNAKILMSSLNFNFYREQYQDFWGSNGRLEIFQEGLFYKLSKIRSHRAIENDKEISIDLSKIKSTKLGISFYKLYDDLINSMKYNLPSLSCIENAVKNEEVIDKIFESSKSKEKIKLKL